MILAQALILPTPSVTPTKDRSIKKPHKPSFVISLKKCPNTQDYIRVKTGTIVFNQDTILQNEIITSSTPGKQEQKTALLFQSTTITQNLHKNDLVMIQDQTYKNVGAGIRVENIQKKSDGIHVAYHGESWILEKHIPNLDAARNANMDATPWDEPVSTNSKVVFEGGKDKPQRIVKIHDIQAMMKAIVICR